MALAGEIANLIVALKLDDTGFSGKINGVAAKLNQLDSGLSRIGRGAGQVASGIDRIATRAALAAAGGLTAVITTAVSFEDAFAGVRKTVDASEQELDALNETFRAMAREIPLSFEELSRIGEQAGALGIATDAIDEFTRVAALIGVTTDVSSDQAATSLGVLANVLHLTQEDFDNFGATLVDLGNKGASTESQILALAERAGAGASLVGIAADQTLGWASALANLGIEVEAGGTSLQKFFTESLMLIQDDDTLAVLAETAGTTAEAFKQAFEQDASAALTQFIVGLGDLDQAAQLAVLETLGFSDVRITRALLGLAGDTDNLTQSLEIAGEAWRENTALTTEAEKRFATTRSQITILVNNLRDVAATVGTELLPVINDLVRDFVEFVNTPTTQGNIRDFARDLADGIRGLVAELKGTDFSGIISGIKLAADVTKAAFDAFRALPQPIQQLAIAALIANKATGGAVGAIAAGLANIIRGLVIATANIQAGVVNVAGPVGGVGGAGGRGGGGGFLAGLIGTAGIIAAIEGGFSALGDITSGTQEGVERGFGTISLGFPGLIARAVTDALEATFPGFTSPTLSDLLGGDGALAKGGIGEKDTELSRSLERLAAATTELREGPATPVVLPDTALSSVTSGLEQVRSTLPPIRTAAERTIAQISLLAATEAREGGSTRATIANTTTAVRSTLPTLQTIAARRTNFNLYATVNLSASGSLSQVNTYTQIREG